MGCCVSHPETSGRFTGNHEAHLLTFVQEELPSMLHRLRIQRGKRSRQAGRSLLRLYYMEEPGMLRT